MDMSSEKDNLIKNMHKQYRDDKWLNEIFESAGIDLDKANIDVAYIARQFWFDTIDAEFLPIYEKLLGIKTNSDLSIEDRRSIVEAKWKSDGKCDLTLIQAVCNSWKNGEVKVSFVDGQIQLKFTGEYGVPTDLDSLYNAVDDIKPAHLQLNYIFAYLLIKDIHKVMTINQLQTHKISDFAFNK